MTNPNDSASLLQLSFQCTMLEARTRKLMIRLDNHKEISGDSITFHGPLQDARLDTLFGEIQSWQWHLEIAAFRRIIRYTKTQCFVVVEMAKKLDLNVWQISAKACAFVEIRQDQVAPACRVEGGPRLGKNPRKHWHINGVVQNSGFNMCCIENNTCRSQRKRNSVVSHERFTLLGAPNELKPYFKVLRYMDISLLRLVWSFCLSRRRKTFP